MKNRDPRVDAYIAKSADFARPILQHIRQLVHKACPEVEETMKWSFPHFDYHGMMCSMAAFKNHCAFGFWKASLMSDSAKIFPKEKDAMGSMGQITSLDDLASDEVMIEYIREAARLNDKGIKRPAPARKQKKPVIVPAILSSALRRNKKAKEIFDALSPSHKREYIEWITEAKTDETKSKRLATAIEWMSEGKSRNWKYEQKKSQGKPTA